MAKNYVKALFGTVISDDFVLKEGAVGVTEKPFAFAEMASNGIVFMSENEEEVRNFKFKPMVDMFNESYASLNPREGTTAPAATMDFNEMNPLKGVDGLPLNHITKTVAPIAPAPAPEPALVLPTVAKVNADKKEDLKK